MMESDNIEALKNLYKLSKRTSQQKIFGQCFQECIEKYLNEEIINKITPEDEKAAKSNFNYMQNKMYFQS